MGFALSPPPSSAVSVAFQIRVGQSRWARDVFPNVGWPLSLHARLSRIHDRVLGLWPYYFPLRLMLYAPLPVSSLTVIPPIQILPMAAPVFVVSADDFVSSSHILTQSLLARFFWESPRPLRLVQSTLKRKWRLTGDLRISPERFGLYQLFFSDKMDVGRVLGHRPLSYDDLPVSIPRWTTPTQEVADRLRFVKYWIRLLDLPKNIRSPAVGKGITSIIETKPLFGRREVDLGFGNFAFIRFQYEGLRQACFHCGRVGHGFRLCPELDSRPFDPSDRGDWMTADRLLCRRLHPETLQPLTAHPKGGRRNPLADDADSGACPVAPPLAPLSPPSAGPAATQSAMEALPLPPQGPIIPGSLLATSALVAQVQPSKSIPPDFHAAGTSAVTGPNLDLPLSFGPTLPSGRNNEINVVANPPKRRLHFLPPRL
ncbi:hypothetical protein LINGRAHAP2_LOCUS36275 [Linum grandiflorum]